MRLLAVNVNTTASMTRAIEAAARSVAAPGTEVVGLTPRFGAASVEGNVESHLAALAVLDAVQRFDDDFDAVILAGYGEHGREALQEAVAQPVVDITEAGAIAAMLVGHRYSVVTTLDRTVPLIEDRLLTAGLTARLASVRASGLAVLELEESAERTASAVVAQARRAIEDDHAEAIVLGCGGMAGLDARIRDELGVPVVDGVAAATTLAEGLVRQGLATSKRRAFAPPHSHGDRPVGDAILEALGVTR